MFGTDALVSFLLKVKLTTVGNASAIAVTGILESTGSGAHQELPLTNKRQRELKRRGEMRAYFFEGKETNDDLFATL